MVDIDSLDIVSGVVAFLAIEERSDEFTLHKRNYIPQHVLSKDFSLRVLVLSTVHQ